MFALIVLLLVYWFCVHTSTLRVSPETTHVTGPLMRDGKRIDYFRAIEDRVYPPEMQTDDNGFRILVREYGLLLPDWAEWSENQKRQMYEKLGLDPAVPPATPLSLADVSTHHVIQNEAKKRYSDKNGGEPVTDETDYGAEHFSVSRQVNENPWTLEEQPFMRDWLDRANPFLDFLGKAVRKPVFTIPYTRENENDLLITTLPQVWPFQMVRDWARSLRVRVQYRLGIGDIDGAIDDLGTIYRLGRHIGRHGLFVDGVVGIAIEDVALAQGIAAKPKFPPTKEQIERLFRELDTLPPRNTVQDCLETERLYMLGCCQDVLYHQSWSQQDLDIEELLSSQTPFYLNLPFPLRYVYDPNIMMRRTNEAMDALVAGTQTEHDFRRTPQWYDCARFIFVRTRTHLVGDVLADLTMPSVHACSEAFRRLECTSNMQRLTLALLLYEKEHGKMPDGDWREAVTPYLGENAERYFHCPSHKTADDETTYAMIADSLLLVEVSKPQKRGEGDGRLPQEKAKFWHTNPDDVLTHMPDSFDGIGSFHLHGGANAGFRSGAVQFLQATMPPEELQKKIDGID